MQAVQGTRLGQQEGRGEASPLLSLQPCTQLATQCCEHGGGRSWGALRPRLWSAWGLEHRLGGPYHFPRCDQLDP